MSNQGEYEVEKILAKRTQGKSTWYLVKWFGYTDADNSWEPLEFLQNAPKKVEEYERRYKSKLIAKPDKEEAAAEEKKAKKKEKAKEKVPNKLKKKAIVQKKRDQPLQKEDIVKKEKVPITINLIEDTESEQEVEKPKQIIEDVNIDDYFLLSNDRQSFHSERALEKDRSNAKLQEEQPFNQPQLASLPRRIQKPEKMISMVVQKEEDEKPIQIRGIKRVEDKLLLKFIYLGKKCKAEYEVIRRHFPTALLSFYEKHCDLFK